MFQISKNFFYLSSQKFYLIQINKLFNIKSNYKISNIVQGALIYSIGDSIAALIINDFSIGRLLGILFLGGFIYSIEIPFTLQWLNKKFVKDDIKIKILKSILFTLYFNPLWIARHLLILNLFKGSYDQITWQLLGIGFSSFIYSFLFTLPANYIIINLIPQKYKFPITALFSSSMAIYYALSEVLFK